MLPLIAAAIAVGGARAAYGAITAKKQNLANKKAIGRGYQVADQQMGLDQADSRQNINESLNARGILTAGAVGNAMTPQRTGLDSMFGGKNAKSNNDRQIGFYDKAGANSLGTSRTLSGQANTDATDAMYRDRRNLNQAKVDALDANKGALKQGYADAITGGINTGLSVYGMGKGMGGGGGVAPMPAPAGAPQVSVTPSAANPNGPMPTIAGAYGMPANPQFPAPSSGGGGTIVAGSGQSNSTFNVPRGPQP